MDMNSKYLCVLVIVSLFDSGHTQFYSPCPDVLEFYSDSGTVFGIITVVPEGVVPELEIRLNYTVLDEINDDYIGRLEAPDTILSRYNHGETVYYRVHLPFLTPFLKVTEIAINGKPICIGPGDKPRPNQAFSSPSLSQTAYYGPGDRLPPYRRFPHEPQRTPYDDARPMFHSLFDDQDDFTKRVENIKMKFFGNDDADPFARIPSSWTTTTSTSPRTTTTTTPVYVEPVTKKSRPVQPISDTPSTTADCGIVAGDDGVQALIQDGFSYDRGEIPWLVAIYRNNKQVLSIICGGTLVSDRHVVTAAHCMYRRVRVPLKDIVVRVGVHELADWGDKLAENTKIIAADIPESYDNSTLDNDIMVLTLDRRLDFNNFIRPACLWSGDTDLSRIVGNIGVVAGWGGLNGYQAEPLNEPQKVHVPIVSTKECRASKAIFHKLASDNTLCAGSRKGDGPCQGDSGGGLYLKEGGKWRLRGVVSKSLEGASSPCDLHEYVVYTDAAQFLPWISSVLEKKFYD